MDSSALKFFLYEIVCDGKMDGWDVSVREARCHDVLRKFNQDRNIGEGVEPRFLRALATPQRCFALIAGPDEEPIERRLDQMGIHYRRVADMTGLAELAEDEN